VPEFVGALSSLEAWAPDLDPDDRYVEVVDLVGSGLAGRVSRRLGGAPERVGFSAGSMGVASRLWSLTVVPAVRHGVVVDPAAVCARDDDGSVVLGVRGGRGFADVGPADVLDVVVAVLAPLVAARPLAPRLHWGNVAASLAVVPRVHGLRPDEPLVADLLSRPPLAGLLDGARRRTCCLFYLAPGAALCGDCPLDHVPTRTREKST
jgi:hypothetical protein